ncbi:fimbrial protein [Bacteroides sp. AN502(2024)]|uniref:fimbrial protein n=1 Tax=Bacteroides sp. AN502(2024) TaxID=3160599 RepID=UPI00351735AD
MRNIRKILYMAVAVVCCGSLLFGCAKDDVATLGERHDVAVRLSVGTRAVSEADGAPTDVEKAIHTLRVYAFVNGKAAGHYFTDNVAAVPHTFFMDLVFYSDGEQTVDFYTVANEAAMSASGSGAPAVLSANTTEEQLKNFWFSNLLRTDLEAKGLPMFCDKTSVTLDFTKVKQESPTASGHEGHAWLDYADIVFELKRPVAKIGVFAAKPAGETGMLRVTGLTMQGARARNYLMTPTQTMLEGIINFTDDIPIAVIGGDVTRELAEGITADERRNPANYTPVMAEPFYPFENPWGNGGSWNMPGVGKEYVLKIDYVFDGEARTGYVYMPKIERNHYYAVCCLMHNDGRITVEYSVADWNETPEYVIEFNYPDYTNPIQPGSVAVTPGSGGQYSQPTVWYNTDGSSDEGSYTFRFEIKGPTGQEWTPTLVGQLGTPDNFEVKVYQFQSDGTKKYIEKPVASSDPYYITVKALKSDNVNKEVGLGIAYTREWSSAGSALLLINGLSDKLKWSGSTLPEVIVIKQTDVSTIND